MQRLWQAQFLFGDGHHEAGTDRRPHLQPHGVFTAARESPQSQVLLDPFAEQLDLPAAAVKLGHRRRGQNELIAQQDQRAARGRIAHAHAAQRAGEAAARPRTGQPHGLVTAQAGGFVHGTRSQHAEAHMTLGTHDKEDAAGVPACQPREVQITPVHHVKGPRLKGG